jgi:hypothetical protein
LATILASQRNTRSDRMAMHAVDDEIRGGDDE